MGMYNELNNISRAVNGQALELKKTQQQQKQAEYIKSELRSMLQNELMDMDNIFDDETKATAIENVLNNTIILLYNKDYTRQFLNDKYYTIVRQVEQIKKKANKYTSDQERLKCEILEIKKQQEAEKLKKLQQKTQQETRKNDIVVSEHTFSYYLYKVVKVLAIAIFAITFGTIWIIIKAASEQK